MSRNFEIVKNGLLSQVDPFTMVTTPEGIGKRKIGADMPKEIFPSSYVCDCGHQSDFFENTIREAKAMSLKKKVHLGDSEPQEHIIVFYKGQMIDIICPHQQPEGKDE